MWYERSIHSLVSQNISKCIHILIVIYTTSKALQVVWREEGTKYNNNSERFKSDTRATTIVDSLILPFIPSFTIYFLFRKFTKFRVWFHAFWLYDIFHTKIVCLKLCHGITNKLLVDKANILYFFIFTHLNFLLRNIEKKINNFINLNAWNLIFSFDSFYWFSFWWRSASLNDISRLIPIHSKLWFHSAIYPNAIEKATH